MGAPASFPPAELALAVEHACAAGVPDADSLIARIRMYDPDVDADRIRRAYGLAAAAHHGQSRQSGTPYIAHPVAVAEILTELHLDADTIITALLHDTVEDTVLTSEQVRAEFGDDVAMLVEGVTKLAQVSRNRGSSDQAENLQKFVLAICEDVRVLLVKLADRLHNMRTLAHKPKPESRVRVSRETLEIYAPLARRIGVQRLCSELEDLAFQWVNPSAYETITRRLDDERATRREAVFQVSDRVAAALHDAGVSARVFGREKRAYSIWRKLERRGIEFDDLADIYGFRVIVETVDDCYRALGVAHRVWRCVPERFKDFISTPKPNNYRSIHTTVVGPDKRRVELQIRTEDMDRIAEAGVAAHWRYKQDSYGYDPDAAQRAGGDPLRRLRPLVEILEHGGDPDEFLENAKLEMFTDQVYAFTPDDDLIALPSGATSLDFAYAVHSEIGDRCLGAKINGRSRPLRTRLRNGDVVEIICGADPAPHPGWESITVTGRARSAIRRLIRRAHRHELVTLGRLIAHSAFHRHGLNLAEARLNDALTRLKLDSEEALFFAMGDDKISGRDLVDAVYPGRARSDVDDTLDRELIPPDAAQAFVRNRSSLETGGAPMTGPTLTPGISLHLATCCSPLPGDRIVAIPGADGARVHTIDCDALAALEDTQDDWIDLIWSREATDKAVSIGRITATVEHVKGALAQIALAVSESHGNITGLRILERSSEFFEMALDVEVFDVRHLSNIVAALRACPVVVSAERAHGGEEDEE